jgi:phosphoglycolate phosphatase
MSGSGRALLFDIDGTLADTDALHLEAFNQVFAPHGHVFDRERASKELMGFSNTSISERFLPGWSPERQAAIMAEKEQAFRTLASGQIKPLAGLMKLLALADRADVPMVAVTNAPRLNAEMMLSGLGIMQRFKAVIIGDELPHGKPHPLPYLERPSSLSHSRIPAPAFNPRRLPASRRLGCGRALAMAIWSLRARSPRPRPLTIRNWWGWSARQ